MDDLQEALGELEQEKPNVALALDKWAFEPHRDALVGDVKGAFNRLLERQSRYYECVELAILELAGRLKKLEEQ